MNDANEEQCGRCGAEIDFSRRVDFTLKDGTRVCEPCFVKETPRPTQPKRDYHSNDGSAGFSAPSTTRLGFSF